MWKWEIVFKMKSTGEEVVISGKAYPDKDTARWMMGEWLRKFLPSFYLYKMESADVKEE